ncbi:MAG: phosphatidate cytidylyltransferase [Anaerolineales bacterium]
MKLRLISAALLIPVVLAAVVLGSWPFALLIVIALALAGVEYRRLLQQKGYAVSLLLLWSGLGVWFVDLLPCVSGALELGWGLVIVGSVIWYVYHHEKRKATASWALTLAGGLYLGYLGLYLVRLRNLEDGLWWILTAFAIVWIGESVAYLVGSRWGVHKMAPALSPGKSWEGYTGDVLSALLVGGLSGWLWPVVAGRALTLTPGRGVLLAAVLVALTPFGDFFVSLIKREVGAKDSGTLIPGHGGVLDRIDSLLWTGLLTWQLLSWLV